MNVLEVILWVVLYSAIFTPLLYAWLRVLFRSPVPLLLLLQATAGTAFLTAALNFTIRPQIPDYGSFGATLYQAAFATLVQSWLISSMALHHAKLRVSFWKTLGATLTAFATPFLLLAVLISRFS